MVDDGAAAARVARLRGALAVAPPRPQVQMFERWPHPFPGAIMNANGEIARDANGNPTYHMAVARPPLFAEDVEVWRGGVLPLLDLMALRAGEVLGRRVSDVVVRDYLIPQEPEPRPWDGDGEGNRWEALVTHEIPPTSLVGVAGVFADYPSLRRLRVQRGHAQIILLVNVLGWVGETIVDTGAVVRYIKPTWFTPRLIFDPQDTIVVRAETVPGEPDGHRRLHFIAFAAEAYGQEVAP